MIHVQREAAWRKHQLRRAVERHRNDDQAGRDQEQIDRPGNKHGHEGWPPHRVAQINRCSPGRRVSSRISPPVIASSNTAMAEADCPVERDTGVEVDEARHHQVAAAAEQRGRDERTERQHQRDHASGQHAGNAERQGDPEEDARAAGAHHARRVVQIAALRQQVDQDREHHERQQPVHGADDHAGPIEQQRHHRRRLRTARAGCC